MTANPPTVPPALPLPAPGDLRLALLDRDGVLNVNLGASVRHPDELTVLDPAPDAVARLTRAGVATAIVTNQGVIGRGALTWETLGAIHAKLFAALAEAGARIDRVYVAPDAPGTSTDGDGARRKPGPGMLLEALRDAGVPAHAAAMVGDTLTDAEAAARAGVAFILVRTGHGAEVEAALPPGRAAAVVDDVGAAVDLLLSARE